ncbi:MAG: metalloprotease PmbA, partial [Coxiella sp. (in: Bacteria)]
MNQQQLQDIVSQALDYAKRIGADCADAIISEECGFAVSSRKGDVEEIEYHQEQGFGISVYQGKRSASVSTTEFSQAAINAVIDKAMSITQYTDEDPYAGLADKSVLAFNYPDLDLFHHWDLETHQAAQMAIECDTIAREQDARITDAEGASVSTYSGLRVYSNTTGFIGGYRSSYHNISCSVIAKEGE